MATNTPYFLLNFNITEAQRCAAFSKLVYKSELEVLSELSKLNADKVAWFSRNGTEAFACVLEEQIYLCFRGTQPTSLRDILADLKAYRTTSYTGGRVHDGFKDALNEIWTYVDAYCKENKFINPQQQTYRKIICTGHSLGAALATLAAKRLSNVYRLYTFGSPRVGNKRWREGLYVSHWRIVNNNDIVTRVPSCLRFAHHGNLVYINHYGNIRKMTPWQRVKDRFRGHFNSWRHFKFFDSFSDHSMERYNDILFSLSK